MFEEICEKLKIPDHRRFCWFFWILLINFFVICVFFIFCNEKFFYNQAIDGFGNIYRFFWVLPFSFIGFSLLALLVAKNGGSKDDKPWVSYIFNYLPRLIALSLIIFSVLHIFAATSNYIFYFLSSGMALYLGYNIDGVKLEDLIKKN